MMLSRDLWPVMLREFEQQWTTYKQANGLLDFTDLIDACLSDVYTAPKNPSVIFADEAQDLNKMQLTLIRKWGRRAEYFIVAGDDDQTIYSFTGATPEAMLDPEIPLDHKIILKQSYRVPQAVHSLANGLIHQVTRRQEKDYLARAEAGSVERLTRGSAWLARVLHPQERLRAYGARPDRDVPDVVLLYVARPRGGPPQEWRTVP